MRSKRHCLAVLAAAFAVAMGTAPASAVAPKAAPLDWSGWGEPDHAEDVRGVKAMGQPANVYTTLWRGMQVSGSGKSEHFWASIDGNTARGDSVWMDVTNDDQSGRWEQCGPFGVGGNGQPVASRAVRFSHYRYARACSSVRGSIACTSWHKLQ